MGIDLKSSGHLCPMRFAASVQSSLITSIYRYVS